MSRNYKSVVEVRIEQPDLSAWADSRETSLAVAAAIHAIADASRSPQAIWESPTDVEVDHVTMAVDEYRRHDDFSPTASEMDGVYCWGQERLRLDQNWIGQR